MSRYSAVSRLRYLAVGGVALLLAGCFAVPPTETPIRSLQVPAQQCTSSTLIVMLPGMGDRAEAFMSAGFLDLGDGVDFDLVAVDAHFGYYMERSLIPRLHQDVVMPAVERCYERIWLLGISMGGFGTLLYADEHFEHVDGVILLAPFLGDRRLARTIESQGGLDAWTHSPGEFDEFEARVWLRLREMASENSTTQVILGYGLSDRLARTYGPLIDALDPDRVYTGPGGHNWTTWRELWTAIAADLSRDL